MNKYLVSYVYLRDEFGIGRVILDLNKVDIESLEYKIKSTLEFKKVVIINVVKLEKENIIFKVLSKAFRKIFKKQLMKYEFKQAKKKEFKI